jgi:hypothetical protein
VFFRNGACSGVASAGAARGPDSVAEGAFDADVCAAMGSAVTNTARKIASEKLFTDLQAIEIGPLIEAKLKIVEAETA